MSPRLAWLAPLLLLAASCGMASDEAGAGSLDRDDGGASGSSNLAGAGGSGEAPGGEAGAAGSVSVAGGSGGSGTAGLGQGGGGGGGPPDPAGGGAGSGGTGAPSSDICVSDADGNAVTECADNPDACAGPACQRPATLQPGATCAVSLTGRPDDVQPWCALAADTGPTAVLEYVAPDKGWLRVEATSARDVILSATAGDCGAPADRCLNQFGPGGHERLRLPVAAGQKVTVLVTGATAKDDGQALVTLRAELERPICGDGKVEGDEVCDDGDADGGDFCSADCLQITGCDDAEALPDDVEQPGPAQPSVGHGPVAGSAAALGSCATVGAKMGRKIHALRAEASGRLEVELVPGSAQDLVLSVRTSCAGGAELACSDARGALEGPGGHERLSLPSEAGETYLLVVEGYGAETGDYELRAQSLPALCGDGLVVHSLEQCEPGGQDGPCTAECTRPVVTAGDAAAAVVVGEGGARERVWPAGDVDEYIVTVAHESFVVVAPPGDQDDCATGRIDSQLTVLNDQGQVIAFNDDAPGAGHAKGRCSEARLPLAGTYSVRVRSSELAAPAQVFSYWLRVVDAGG